MRIVLVTPEFSKNEGGLAKSAVLFKDRLERLFSADVFVVVTLWSDSEREYTAPGGYSGSVSRAIENEYRLKMVIRAVGSAEFVVAFGGGFNSYFASEVARGVGGRLYVCLRGSDGNLMRWESEGLFFTREACCHASAITGVSQELCQRILSKVSVAESRLSVIPNSALIDDNVNIGAFKKLWSDAEVFVFGSGAAHLNEKKGVLSLLRFVAALREQARCRIRLELAGEVDQDLKANYLAEAERLGIASDIMFVGAISRDGFVGDWMSRIDCYVQGSVCEGFGNSVAEAMSKGVPVVLTPTGYFAEQFLTLLPDAVFKSFNPQEMACAFMSLAQSEDLEARYAAAYSSLRDLLSEASVDRLWKEFLTARHYETSGTGRLSLGHVNAVMLHDIRPEMCDGITVTPEMLDRLLNKIKEKGFVGCSMKEYLSCSQCDRARMIVLTFDDAYCGVVQYALPTISRFGWTATVFVNVGLMGCDNDWNCKDKVRRYHLSRDGVARLRDAGWEIGSHGVTHRSLLKLSESEVYCELSESKRVLEDSFGPICSYAYPYGDYTPFIREAASRYYKFAFAVSGGGNHLSVDSHSLRRYTPDEMIRLLEVGE